MFPFVVEHLWREVRFGLRGLRRQRTLTLGVVSTLALGIGVTVATFCVANAVLLRPLPFFRSEQLVAIAETHPEMSRLQVAALDFRDWQGQVQSFSDLAAYSLESNDMLTLIEGGEPEQLQGSCMTSNLFPLLGISPALGRTFTIEEEQPGRDRVVVISDGLWKRRFASSQNLVGSSIRLNGESHVVVGIMPAGVQLPFQTDVWLPISRVGPGNLNNRVFHSLEVVGRLKPQVSLAQAQGEMTAIATRLQQSYPATNKTIGVAVTPLQNQLTGDLRPILFALVAVVGLVLLITCANVSNLLLARAWQRRSEFAIRAALGASRLTLFRQFMIECLILAFAGGLGGVLLAVLCLPI